MPAINADSYMNLIIRQQDRIKELIDLIPLWEVDDKFVFVSVSSKTSDMMGYGMDELIGRTPFDFMPQNGAKKLKKHLITIFSDRKAFSSFEAVFLKKNGQ